MPSDFTDSDFIALFGLFEIDKMCPVCLGHLYALHVCRGICGAEPTSYDKADVVCVGARWGQSSAATSLESPLLHRKHAVVSDWPSRGSAMRRSRQKISLDFWKLIQGPRSGFDMRVSMVLKCQRHSTCWAPYIQQLHASLREARGKQSLSKES